MKPKVEASVFSVLGPWVAHVSYHNVGHRSQSFLEAGAKAWLHVARGRGCCRLGVAGKVSRKRRGFCDMEGVVLGST